MIELLLLLAFCKFTGERRRAEILRIGAVAVFTFASGWAVGKFW
jgi:hypothetical protein